MPLNPHLQDRERGINPMKITRIRRQILQQCFCIVAHANKLSTVMSRGVIAYNDRQRLTSIETIVLRKNVISYKVDEDLLGDRILMNNP